MQYQSFGILRPHQRFQTTPHQQVHELGDWISRVLSPAMITKGSEINTVWEVSWIVWVAGVGCTVFWELRTGVSVKGQSGLERWIHTSSTNVPLQAAQCGSGAYVY